MDFCQPAMGMRGYIKTLSRSEEADCAFVDEYERTYQIIHSDMHIRFLEHVSLQSCDGTFLDAKGKSALLIFCVGGFGLRLSADGSDTGPFLEDYEVPSDNMLVEIIDPDCFAYARNGIWFLDHSPATLGL